MNRTDDNRSAFDLPYARDWALFLDVDGTLVELAGHPGRVELDAGLPGLLRGLNDGLDGALALISGRPLAGIDALFGLGDLAAAGSHGMEIRGGGPEKVTRVHAADEAAMEHFRRQLKAFADAHPAVWVEDKSLSLAVHYREAPELEERVRRVLGEMLAGRDGEFHVQTGKMIAEIKPRAFNKGHAVGEFMQERPFHGRTPVFIGDDVTDEDGFGAVNELNGISIKVGDGETRARYRLSGPRDVIMWLEAYRRFLQQ